MLCRRIVFGLLNWPSSALCSLFEIHQNRLVKQFIFTCIWYRPEDLGAILNNVIIYYS